MTDTNYLYEYFLVNSPDLKASDEGEEASQESDSE